MDMNTSGMKTLVISVYKKYGAVLFKGVAQLKLFPETTIKHLEWYHGVAQLKLFPETTIKHLEWYRSVAQFEGAAQIK